MYNHACIENTQYSGTAAKEETMEQVSLLSIVFICIHGILGIMTPVAVCILLRKRAHADLPPFFAGCAVMILFAFVLEQIVHRIVLGSPIGQTLRDNLLLYCLYGGIMAGLFEETGRFLAFKTVLKKYANDADALMYGAGHGGVEWFILAGITSVNNLIYAYLLNSGQKDVVTAGLTGDALAQAETVFAALAATPASLFLLSSVERVMAFALQMALSVLVWFAVKHFKTRLFLLAIALHAFVDASAAMLAGLGVPTVLIECLLALITGAACIAVRILWTRERNSSSTMNPA